MTNPTVEIVSHCWNYSRLLSYQLSSLCLYPPPFNVRATVFCCREDKATMTTLGNFIVSEDRPAHIEVRPWVIDRPKLMRRAIGRNMAAMTTEAELVWMADVDMLFREGCLESLCDTFLKDIVLAFPRIVNKSRSMKHGDNIIHAMPETDHAIMDIPEKSFRRVRMKRAIGGVQIVKGSTAHRHGYLNARKYRKHHKPEEEWRKTREDPVFRRSLASGSGEPLEIVKSYRIRHSQYGREHVGARN